MRNDWDWNNLDAVPICVNNCRPDLYNCKGTYAAHRYDPDLKQGRALW